MRSPPTEDRALYLYPTKALAQDQARSLGELGVPGSRAAIYDGDTPHERRRQIRDWANLVLTNPDMLHIGVLPRHDLWGDLLHNLRFVVVDEAHVYRGVFGSHVANVLRRLRRAGSRLRSRAAVPARLGHDRESRRARAFALGEEATVVDDDARAARRTDDRALEPAADRRRARHPRERARRRVASDGRARATRPAYDLLCKEPQVGGADPPLRHDRVDAETAKRLAPYRAGYTPQQRRDIERRLVEGELLGVTSTDALELGIDIGLLDCAISVGFPGTVASLRQQWGRAGRRESRARGPRRLRGCARPVLHARARDAARAGGSRRRSSITRTRACSTDTSRQRRSRPPSTRPTPETLGAEALERAPHVPKLQQTKHGWVWAGKDSPAARTPLRSASPDSFLVVDA